MSALACPECGCNDGSKILGHVEYDRVLWWACLSCGWGWPRDFGDWEKFNRLAREAADAHNARGSAGVTRR